jgi:hypothetical protein
MSPREVQGLQALAENHGGSLTINPETGLPEAGILDKLLPAIIGFGLNYFVPGLGSAVGSALGTSAAVGTGVAVGGFEALRTGDIGKGISAGLGAYGGAGLQTSLAGAGSSAIGGEAARAASGLTGDMAFNLADAGSSLSNTLAGGETGILSSSALSDEAIKGIQQQAAADKIAAATPFDKLSRGFNVAKANPSSLLTKDNFKYLGAAAAPILADQAVKSNLPTTATKPGMIRPYSYDPYGGTYTAGTPYEATPTKAAGGGLMGMNDGGYNPGQLDFTQRSEPVVRMASGGIAGYAAGGVSDADILGWFNANPGADDSLIAQTMQQANVTPEQVARATGSDYANVNERYLAATAPAAAAPVDYFAQQFAPDVFAPVANTGGAAAGTGYQSVNDLYQGVLGRGVESEGAAGYWQNLFGPTIDANEVAQFQQAAQAELAGRNAGATGGLDALAATPAFSNQYTFANINDYIANNNLDAAGIAAAAKQFNVDPAQITAAQNAQSVVSNVFRNVLGRDPDPNGLDYWTNQIMTGKSTGQEMLDTFIKNAQANKEIIVNPNIKLEDAVKEFGGYKSSGARDVVDEWVRNTLGREVTEADKKQQWYKDAVNDAVMNTYGKAQDIYGGFKTYAQGEATVATARAINDATTALAARGLTEADVIKQTGKTIAQLVAGSTNLGLDLYQASQLKAPGAASKFDFNTIQKAKAVPPVVPSVVPPAGVIPGGFYGNATNPGDITTNPDGTVTVTPNIPYRPDGGFSGMGEVRDAYTKGGGSLGYVPYAPKTIEEFESKYNTLTGGSKQSYDYLTGKTPYNPTPSTKTGEIMKPYFESVGRFPENRKAKKYVFVDGKYQLNPDYVKPAYVLAGEKAAALADPDNIPTAKAGEGKKWVWNAEAKKWEAKPIEAESNTTTTGQNDGGGGGGDMANGGLAAMARGGMSQQFDLGGYSDGGRLLRGPGDGVSDSIPATIGNKRPARLADGEFVVPARIVSELGNGSTEAGARKLYAMMDRVQKARRGTVGKGRVAKNSRSDKYLPA